MADKLNPDLSAVQDSMMHGLGQLADYFGYNRVMGEIYAVLLLNPGPMSLDDLKDRVKKSKASVSMNTRTLEYMGAVREVWVREDNPSNRKFYEAEGDFWKIAEKILGGRELRDLETALDVLGQNMEQLSTSKRSMSEDERKLAEFYQERLDRLTEFFRFAKLILTSILQRGPKIDMSEVTRIDIE
jgi:DNA-binding transcriptional regulator GbsR (MarR family)